MQGFLRRVEEKISEARSAAAPAAAGADAAATPATVPGGPPATPAVPAPAAAAAAAVVATPAAGAADATSPVGKTYETLLSILSGFWPVRLNLEFLYWHDATDLQILRNIKGTFNARVSMCHSALVMANAFMHAGTTVDTFLRDNLDWLKTATNWAMFGATASLGVIHRGHLGKVCPLRA
jgi:26S proteasome regulatory subunit N2